MSFTYDIAGGGDVAWVRFHTGDTDADTALLSDEEITFILGERSGDKQGAALDCIRTMIAKLSQPNFTADWLTVSTAAAIQAYEKLLAEKKSAFGVRVKVGSVNQTRSDVHPARNPRLPDGW